MAEAEFVQYLDISDVELYCKSSNAEERQNIICNKIKTSLCCYNKGVYFYNDAHRVFKRVGDKKDDILLKSLIESYVRNSMLVLTKEPISKDPNAEDEIHRENRRVLRQVSNEKMYEKAIQELNNYSPKNIQAFKLKLELPVGIEMDSDLEGIHFVNGRFDLKTLQFAEREVPNYSKPTSFVTKFIPYEFGPCNKALCDELYDHLLKSFGTREKLDYCLAYAGAALQGRSAVTSCSAMFHVGIGGSGKTTFTDWIKAAVTDVYYKDLPLSTFDKVWTAYKTFSTIPPSVRFLFAQELNSTPKDSSIFKCICDGILTVVKKGQDGSHDIKINAKLFCTSNNPILFREDDSGVKRRLQYCLHENRFVDGPDLALVNNIDVFPMVKVDMTQLPVESRLAMFYLIISYCGKIPDSRPAGIYDGDTLFNMKAFVDEYFVLEEEEKVSKDDVIRLANKFFHQMEFQEDYILKKLLKVKTKHKIRYDKNRSVDKARGVFVNIGLNEKTSKMMKKSPDVFVPTETDSWRTSLRASQDSSVGFGGISSASSVPVSVFVAPTSFGGSAPVVEPELVAKVPKKKKSVSISCRDETHDIDVKVMSDGVGKMNVDEDVSSDAEMEEEDEVSEEEEEESEEEEEESEEEEEEEMEIDKPVFKPYKAKSRVNKELLKLVKK